MMPFMETVNSIVANTDHWGALQSIIKPLLAMVLKKAPIQSRATT